MATQAGTMEYLRYWGKARPREDAGAAWHPLVFHSLDVAAVGVALLNADPHLRARLADVSAMDEATVLRWLFLALALHDIGKFAPDFQRKVEGLEGAIAFDARCAGGSDGHDADGQLLWLDMREDDRPALLAAFCTATDDDGFRRLTEVRAWVAAAICHHGRARSPSGGRVQDHFPSAARAVIEGYLEAVVSIAAGVGRAGEAAPQQQWRASWLVAGLAVLADWIGSNQSWFPYRATSDVVSVDAYWHRFALPQAERALRLSGIVPAGPAMSITIGDLLPGEAKATPLQRTVGEMGLGDGPELYVIEDQTGAGKTEAALLLAARLIQAGRADGVFVALPTMATANAMYRRCERLYRRLFAPGSSPSILLAHSRRELVSDWLATLGRREEGDYGEDLETASAAAARWLGDDRRKSALADCGIGTVDQAVLAVMPSRFHALRLAGLCRKVLIVDEVHAHDAYLGGLIQGLLRFHAALGGSAILLSATLPARQRAHYAKAFAEGLETQVRLPAREDDAYPLLSRLCRDGAEAVPIAPRQCLQRTLRMKFLDDADAAAALVVDAAGRGAAVCWIRNTVADAMDGYERARAQVPARLFHARFAMCDRLAIEEAVLDRFGPASRADARRGQVLIATQVVEQSLDLDFDVMVSDLAPIDSLIQRAGRLHRHSREGRVGDPVLHVVAPDPGVTADAGWFSRMFRGAAMVYPDHAALWLTADELRQRGHVCLPDDARAVIEAVYGAEADGRVPPGLRKSRLRAEGAGWADAATAASALLNLTAGYAGAPRKTEDELFVPTRLGEPQSQLRLARWEDGHLRPWAEGGDWRAWRMSEVTVMRRYIAAEAPTEDAALAAAVRAVRAEWPEHARQSLLIPLVPGEADAWVGKAMDERGRVQELYYERSLGLRIFLAVV